MNERGGSGQLHALAVSQAEFNALLEAHLRWRLGQSSDGPLDLSGLSFQGVDLLARHLRHATFTSADLTGCDLTGTDFYEAQLAGVNVRGAQCSGCTFSRSDLRGANFTDADLRGTLWERTNAFGAVMTRAFLDRSVLRSTYLAGADLRDARVRDASMRGTRFSRTRIAGADFSGSQGTVAAGSTVLLAGRADPVDAAAALNAVGARVTEYGPKDRWIFP